MKNIIPSREEFSAMYKTASGGKDGVRFSFFGGSQFGKDGLTEQELYDSLKRTWNKVLHEPTNHTNFFKQEGRELWVIGVLRDLGMELEN